MLSCSLSNAGTVFFYLGSLVALGFMYAYYAPKASCGTNIAFITITIICASVCWVGHRMHQTPQPLSQAFHHLVRVGF
jgi:Serine incorporator (Serinc)